MLITHISDITPAWLTQALRQGGALPKGEVLRLEARPFSTMTAQAYQLTADYSPNAPPHLPRQFFLKIGHRLNEALFYQHLAPDMPDELVLRPYHIWYETSGHSQLLFEDLGATHHEAEETLPQPEDVCQRLLALLAGVHAHWWEHPRLSGDIEVLARRDDVLNEVIGRAREHFGDFVAHLGDRLSAARRDYLERVLADWPPPRYRQRIASGRGLTVVHGDAHFWNFLYPKTPHGRIIIADWAVWHINVPSYDPAYMLGLHCSSERRERIERPLLRAYHQALVLHGIDDYEWVDCWEDYRLMMSYQIVWPVFWHAFTPPTIWWYGLENAMSAFEDLECIAYYPR